MSSKGLKPGFWTGKTALERTASLFWVSQHWHEQGDLDDSDFSGGLQQQDLHTAADSTWQHGVSTWQHGVALSYCAALSEQPHPSHWQITGGASVPSNMAPIVIQATHCRNVFCRIVIVRDSFTLLCVRFGFYATPVHCTLYRTFGGESTTFWEKSKFFIKNLFGNVKLGNLRGHCPVFLMALCAILGVFPFRREDALMERGHHAAGEKDTYWEWISSVLYLTKNCHPSCRTRLFNNFGNRILNDSAGTRRFELRNQFPHGRFLYDRRNSKPLIVRKTWNRRILQCG